MLQNKNRPNLTHERPANICLTHIVLCFSRSYVQYVASFSELFIFYCPVERFVGIFMLQNKIYYYH
jgi:hypothetical protein